ncbi:MAG: AAA family ATPase [Deltaproteobacteria bacterium]|nr:AAA family ATPase [Deltaproteobacteria bacterium]
MARQVRRGKLIVLEGPDGVGKSTLSKVLTEKLSEANIPCEHLSFPGKEEGTIGRLVYDLHHDPGAFGLHKVTPASWQALHIASHLDAIEQRILPALSEGRWVVLDRFWWSTWVYGNASAIDRRSLDAMTRLERFHWNGVKPAVVFMIDRDQNVSEDKTRGQLRAGYHAILKKERGRYPIRVIQNDGSLNESLDQLLGKLRELIPQLRKTRWNAQPHQSQRPSAQLILIAPHAGLPSVFTALSPARTTVVYDTLWRFAAERQQVFFRKLEGRSPPWTHDPIIRRHKFTNAYRASDRVSQYLIRHVIYEGDQASQEVFFRTILFKLFNKIETWELLKAKLGTISYAEYSFARYDQVLTEAMSCGTRIYSAAYIMPSGKSSFGHPQKHRNYLRLLERMMEDETSDRIANAPNMKRAFELLRCYPTVGDFLAYQYVTDLNYSTLTDFSEMEFVVPGPGAMDGIHKTFSDLGGLNETEIIQLVTERQEREFDRLALRFRSLWGRRLQLIDCQNLFCEVSKYARLKHPEIKGDSDRTRIKQLYRPSNKPLEYWYPPKWGINQLIPRSGGLE